MRIDIYTKKKLFYQYKKSNFNSLNWNETTLCLLDEL